MQAAESFNFATLAGQCVMAKDHMEGKEEMKCYSWFYGTKKIDKNTLLNTILMK